MNASIDILLANYGRKLGFYTSDLVMVLLQPRRMGQMQHHVMRPDAEFNSARFFMSPDSLVRRLMNRKIKDERSS